MEMSNRRAFVKIVHSPGLIILIIALFVLWSACSPSKDNIGRSEDIKIEAIEAIKITSGPKQHWFGYYDKLQMDPSGRYVLGMAADLFYRSPTNQDTLEIGMVDLMNNNEWIPLGTSKAWGWQQGCMLQWVPGSPSKIIWNDIQEGTFVSHILDVKTREKSTLPRAIYTVSNDGTFALGTEFSRIQEHRSGYGYPGVADPYIDQKHPSEIGIYKMDLETGQSEMLFSIADLATQPMLGEDISGYWHWFNHLLISPDDQRFVFLHRWRSKEGSLTVGGNLFKSFATRMITANVDGSDRFVLDPSGYTSHFIWLNNEQLCMWTKPIGRDFGFYLYTDKTEELIPVGVGLMTRNGHNTYVPTTSGKWILNDTYPAKGTRLQTLYLFNTESNEKVVLGDFFAPEAFTGEWRVDLHPKATSDGKWVLFDSTHEGDGRQMYMMGIEDIVK